MTHRRQRVLRELARASEQGRRLTLAELARRTGLYDYREARKTLRHIERYGLRLADD